MRRPRLLPSDGNPNSYSLITPMTNMICTLDQNDYCERHKTQHKGRLKELALDPGELGEKYRQLWDRQAKVDYFRQPDKPKGCGCNKG